MQEKKMATKEKKKWNKKEDNKMATKKIKKWSTKEDNVRKENGNKRETKMKHKRRLCK
jgi:hypothetical protein